MSARLRVWHTLHPYTFAAAACAAAADTITATDLAVGGAVAGTTDCCFIPPKHGQVHVDSVVASVLMAHRKHKKMHLKLQVQLGTNMHNTVTGAHAHNSVCTNMSDVLSAMCCLDSSSRAEALA